MLSADETTKGDKCLCAYDTMSMRYDICDMLVMLRCKTRKRRRVGVKVQCEPRRRHGTNDCRCNERDGCEMREMPRELDLPGRPIPPSFALRRTDREKRHFRILLHLHEFNRLRVLWLGRAAVA